MTNWLPDIGLTEGPRYLAIAAAIEKAIEDGILLPGSRLPTHRELAWRLGVTIGTVTRAYGEAARLGLVTGEVGRGTYVRSLTATAPPFPEGPDKQPGFIDLSYSVPPVGGAERTAFGSLAALVREPESARLLGYQHPEDLATWQAATAQWLGFRGLSPRHEQIILTAGAQHGISVAFAGLAGPGETILTEELTYYGVNPVARLLGVQLKGLPCDQQGVLPDALEAACRHQQVKAFYCIPSLQNPTAITMPEDRRRAVADIANKLGIAIIEDDVFGMYAADPLPTISQFAPQHTYYLSSLSKTVAPGLRVGFLVTPPGVRERLSPALRGSGWLASPVTLGLAARWITDGTAEQIFRARQQEAHARSRLAQDILAPWQPTCPAGSLYCWLPLPEPWRASDFAQQAARSHVLVSISETFAIGHGRVPQALRICLGPPADRASLEKGLQLIARLLAEEEVGGLPQIV